MDGDLHNESFEEDGYKKDESANELTPQECKRGKPVHSIWEIFTKQKNTHQVLSGKSCICKHCKQMYTHHNKVANVHIHLNECYPILEQMKKLKELKCFEWWDNYYQSSSTSKSLTQSSITKFAPKALMAVQMEALQEKVAMHFYLTATSFNNIRRNICCKHSNSLLVVLYCQHA